jgi:hypothetical protein
MAVADDHVGWRDVPDVIVPAWRGIFVQSTSGLDLDDPCPVCGAYDLHRWFYLENGEPGQSTQRNWQGPGSQWQWCSNCRSYEHSSGLVPDWWRTELVVDPHLLRHDPGPIEEARSH